MKNIILTLLLCTLFNQANAQNHIVDIYKNKGMIGKWSNKCDEKKYYIAYTVQDDKVIGETYQDGKIMPANNSIVKYAETLPPNKIKYESVIMNADGLTIRTVNGILEVTQGQKYRILFLSIKNANTNDQKIVIKDGKNLGDGSETGQFTKCNF